MAGEPVYPATYPVVGTLRIAEDLVRALVSQAHAAQPNEACGVASGRPGKVARLHPLTNTAASAERYSVDPLEQLEAYRAMADDGLECVAVYHSHPATPARPSVTDIAEAYDPDVAYVIVSLAAAEPSIRAFRIADGTVGELTIETAASPAGAGEPTTEG